MGRPIKDLVGKKFGKLTVIRFVERRDKLTFWFCKCDCGGTKVASSSHMKAGSTSSCGCARLGKNPGRIGTEREQVIAVKEKMVELIPRDPEQHSRVFRRWQKIKAMAAAYRKAQGDSDYTEAKKYYVSMYAGNGKER